MPLAMWKKPLSAPHPKIPITPNEAPLMKRLWLLFAQSCTLLLAAYFVVGTLKPQWLGGSRSGFGVVSVQQVGDRSEPPPGSFRVAAQRASLAVVSITTNTAARQSPHGKDPWFRFFYGDNDNEAQNGLGSGVIVSTSGYVLTNNHVVENADEIEVSLNDGRRAKATVVGTDPDSDLAVLKIELEELPTLVLGDSNSLQVGDQVLAIGNPFGVGQTVTSGIVSAMGRNQLGINTFENFIQTDAAINPGNSGGALVDSSGNLVGINTAIYSRSGGSMGIGFAIPVFTARQVLESIVAEGQVRRGWIGVEPREITPEIAQTFGLKAANGVVVTGVLHNGPAAKAGMEPGDVIVAIGGKAIHDASELLTQVAALKPGAVTGFSVDRKGKSLNLQITPGQRPRPQREPG
jgi:Do/DeqQ family serine protease